MKIMDKKLEEIKDVDVLVWAEAKLKAMGFTDTDTIQVNL